MGDQGRYRGDIPDLLERIKQLENRLSRLERTPQVDNTAVNTGGITIRGGSLDVYRGGSFVNNNDSWSRAVTNGWGSTNSGTPWTVNDGPASAFSVDGSSGLITIPTVNTTHRALLSVVALKDFTFSVEFLVTVIPTGGFIESKIDFRWVDVNNRLGINIDIQTNSTVSVSLYQVVGGSTTTLGGPVTIPNLQFSTVAPIKIKIASLNKTIKAKLWLTTSNEPTAWQVSTNNVDPSLSTSGGTGTMGLGAFLQNTNSNTLPVVIKFDNLQISDPKYVEDGQSEGRLSVGSNVPINSEQGIDLLVQRSDSVPSANKDFDGNIETGLNSMLFGTVDGSAIDPTLAVPSWEIYDKSGDPVLADSRNARRGFSDPVLDYAFQDGTFKSSTSGTFAFIMTCEWYMYHAHFRIRVLVQNDASNASELRVTENGGTYSVVTSVPAGANQYMDLVVPRSSMFSGSAPNGNPALMNLEHRRSSGAGTIRTQIISCVGIDLSYFNPF